MISSLTPLVKAFTWTIGSIFYLQNIGVQMTAIWALLSAGGIGAGLALKDPVQEFFEYITILLDKPFQKGEFIKSDGVLGMVERVGVRSSRIRSINGVSEDTIELIEESLIFEVDSVKDFIKTLLRAFIIIININNFRIFNNTEIKVISSAKK